MKINKIVVRLARLVAEGIKGTRVGNVGGRWRQGLDIHIPTTGVCIWHIGHVQQVAPVDK